MSGGMAMKTAFVVQPFELHRKRLRPRRQEQASTNSGTLKKAENLAKQMPGAAVLKRVADDETSELEDVTILGQWADIPDNFAESLQERLDLRSSAHWQIDQTFEDIRGRLSTRNQPSATRVHVSDQDYILYVPRASN